MANFIFRSFIANMRIETLPEIRREKLHFKAGRILFQKLTPKGDLFKKAYAEIQRENAMIYSALLAPKSAEKAEKIMELPGYNLYYILLVSNEL